MKLIKVAGAALNQTPFDWEGNKANIIMAIEQARQAGVKILCLPELCITGYGCEDMFLSEWLPIKAKEILEQIIPHTHDITVAIGLPVKKGNLYNGACLIQNTKVLGITAKQFLANDGVHYEPRWFTPWPADQISSVEIGGKEVPFGDVIYKVEGFTIGFEICEDMWHATDRPVCRHHKKGVNLIMNPSASHFAFSKSKKRVQLIIDATRDYNCHYVYANLLGNEAGRMVYDGEVVIASFGHIVKRNKRLSYKSINLTTTDIDLDADHPTSISKLKEENKFDVFTRAASLALFDYLRKSHSGGFVLSLSGGADSSTCAILVAEMTRRAIKEIGVKEFLDKIHLSRLIPELEGKSEAEIFKTINAAIFTCAYQGTKNSSQATLDSARELANEIGAEFHAWLIDEEVNTYSQKIEKVIGRSLSWQQDDIALQNIQARARAPIIWMLANIKNALLLVTSNRSEGDVGYATMDGDTSGSIAPIAAVDKHFIINWLRWAETNLGYHSLRHVNNLEPTAELRPKEQTQTDEKDLMPYHILVEIERLAIRERKHPIEVFEQMTKITKEPGEVLKGYIKKFYRLWCRNQWKRERTAPAFHLDDFNVDPRTWCRFPILSSSFEEELKELDKI